MVVEKMFDFTDGNIFSTILPEVKHEKVISWRSGLLVEETGGPGENHRPVASH
jgi:hypothetical protein